MTTKRAATKIKKKEPHWDVDGVGVFGMEGGVGGGDNVGGVGGHGGDGKRDG